MLSFIAPISEFSTQFLFYILSVSFHILLFSISDTKGLNLVGCKILITMKLATCYEIPHGSALLLSVTDQLVLGVKH